MPLYFVKFALLFWVPGIILTAVTWKRLTPAERRAFWWVCGAMAVVSFAMEYVYLWADIWNFSEAHDPLLGIRLWGAPIEEFVFWFGASPFILSIYLTLRRWRRRRRRGVSARPVRRARVSG